MKRQRPGHKPNQIGHVFVAKVLIQVYRMCLNRFVVAAGAVLLAAQLNAQVLEPVKWTWKASSTSVKPGDKIDIVFDGTIDPGWYVYSNGFDPDCGPLITTFTFEPDASYKLVGNPQPAGDHTKHDNIFDCDVRVFEKAARFKQQIEILKAGVRVSGSYEGQVCSETEGKCVLFSGDFSIDDLGAGAVIRPEQKTLEQATVNPVKFKVDSAAAAPATETGTDVSEPIMGPRLDDALVRQMPQQQSIWLFLVVSFLAGFAALVTPCVFPMIPMTVTFFTGKANKGHALIFGVSVIVIYTLAGGLVAPLMGPETANQLSTEWIPNLIFFLVFIVFGLSFLGLFDITVPGTLINRMDRRADKGGLTGVFFMAFTLVLVSFSCTGPIVGSILVSSAGGEYLKPILGMFAFALAFSIPFTLFAIFPGWLSSLPKSGGWLNAVKVVLGFLELALAFKFLSIADQAFHWGVLDREVNIAIWIVIFILIGIYLMKGFRMPGDVVPGKEPDKTVSVPRVVLAIASFTFVVYLVPGMWGAPLKALAGYLPPMYTHDFDLIGSMRNENTSTLCDEPRFANFLHLPHGLNGYFDYEQALSCARKQGKPLFIDFTGHGCTNCREMEAVVWSDEEVLQRLRNDYVIVALYVDDKTTLPESEWVVSSYDGKTKKTIGRVNADIQISRLNNNAQPFYVLVGRDERVLAPPYGYDRGVSRFVEFLDAGKMRYEELYR